MYYAPRDIDRSKLVAISGDEHPDDIIKACIRNIITVLGDDPDRSGLQETPDRVMRMYKEIYEGMNYTNDEIAEKYNKCFEDVNTGDLVVVGDITIFSNCEHHLALMYNQKVHVGYIPNGKVIGLSKVARIADMVSKRLQLQERIGMDIADILEKVLDTNDIIVVVEGEHSCMTARGIRKPGSKTRTAAIRGKFETDYELRQEFYNLIK
jgi:GTP cyclohydrolase I